MAVLLNCQSLSKTYGHRPLFRDITLTLEEGERVGLIGPNGAGKSTLLKILAGVEQADTGTVSLKRGLTLGYLPQTEAFPAEQPVGELVAEALAAGVPDAHERELRAARLLSQAGFAPDRQNVPFGTLSGGWRKRAALARELAREPGLLLLDEPTNHLDLEGVFWLEKLLRNAPFGFLLISHDRYFLERVTNRVIELNGRYPDGYFSASGAYSDFLQHREAFFAGQEAAERALAGTVRREIEWLRRGPPARTTKSRARTDEAHRKIGELAELRGRNAQTGSVQLDFSASGRQANTLIKAKGLCKSLGGRTLIDGLDLTLVPGMKLGLLGSNGSGKTTLIRMLAGELEPDSGSIERALGLQAVCFGQNREQLDPAWTLAHALCPVGDRVNFRGQAIHVSGWARRFLFRTEQLEMPVGSLSGGEQARILLARLMLRPADVLLLDEPTNDLDIESLEVLEESLGSFPGAVVLVTHDRYLLQRLECEILGFDGDGSVRVFADYPQWEAAFGEARKAESQSKSAAAQAAQAAQREAPKRAKKLSYKEQQEWDGMEERILAAETAVAELQNAVNDPAAAGDHTELQRRCAVLAAKQAEVEGLYVRWQELEEKQRAQ